MKLVQWPPPEVPAFDPEPAPEEDWPPRENARANHTEEQATLASLEQYANDPDWPPVDDWQDAAADALEDADEVNGDLE